jgi:hypothetical protein
MYFIVTTTQGLRFDRSRLVELWQIKDKRGLRSRVSAEHWFLVSFGVARKRIRKEPGRYSESGSAGKGF